MRAACDARCECCPVPFLPPRQREVVLLKVFSEMTYREVAETLRLSEGAVKAHLHQAVSNLRRSMSSSRTEIEVAP